MKLIAHRALMEGPDKGLENDPKQVELALSRGFDVEIDLWYADRCWMLGHDYPQYIIKKDFLDTPGLWIHCKDLTSFFTLRREKHTSNYFWHDTDKVVLTNQGNVWTYFGFPEMLNEMSICVMPEVNYTWEAIESIYRNNLCMGICSDHVARMQTWQE